MTNDSRLGNNNFIVNHLKTKNTIKLNMLNGVLEGNIIDHIVIPVVVVPPEPVSCVLDSLDFRCSENSQYIPLV